MTLASGLQILAVLALVAYLVVALILPDRFS